MMLFEDKNKEEREALEKFLSMSVKSSDEVIDTFAKLPNAIFCQGKKPNERFVYIPGTRDDKVLLVAHADTVWDKNWMPELLDIPQTLGYRFGRYYNTNPRSLSGIGADDRAGCAILYLLRKSGHSILIVDGEEHGQVGSKFLRKEHPEIFEEINNHCYALQFDRRNDSDYKCYNIPVTNNFKHFLESNLGYHDAGTKSGTDIVTLCQKICGANLSVGYYGEHTEFERLYFKQWLQTYTKVSKLLEQEQQKFPTQKTLSNDQYESQHQIHIDNQNNEMSL